MIPQDLHYNFSEASYLGLCVLVFILLFWNLFRYRDQLLKGWEEAKMVFPRSSATFWIKVVCLSAAWIVLTMALMQPKGNGHYPEEAVPKERMGQVHNKVQRKAHEIIFLIDASASMNIVDTRLEKTRLEYAKEIADSIVSQLEGATAALYVFTSVLDEIVPPTSDYLFLRMMLAQISINEGGNEGTDFVEALTGIRKHYFIPDQKLKTLIIFSDGGDTYLETLQGQERQKEIDAIANLVSDAASVHMRVYTIGLGSKQGGDIPGIVFEGKRVHSDLDEELLKKISEKGRGLYYYANDLGSEEIARDLLKNANRDELYEENLADQQDNGAKDLIYNLYFQIPLGIALVLLAFILLLPETTSFWRR